jgi:hypothetical protein
VLQRRNFQVIIEVEFLSECLNRGGDVAERRNSGQIIRGCFVVAVDGSGQVFGIAVFLVQENIWPFPDLVIKVMHSRFVDELELMLGYWHRKHLLFNMVINQLLKEDMLINSGIIPNCFFHYQNLIF